MMSLGSRWADRPFVATKGAELLPVSRDPAKSDATASKVEMLRALSVTPAEPAKTGHWPIGLVLAGGAGLVSTALLAAYIFVWRDAPGKADTAAPMRASAAPAGPAATGNLVASGFVVARRQATVAAEVTGRVLELRIEEGQRVRRGEILAVLDDSSVSAELAAASARARSSVATVDAPTAELAQARDVAERGDRLALRGFITKADIVRNHARVSQIEAQVRAARADAAAAAADLRRARIQMSRYAIRAPFSGIVIDKNAQPGEIISPVSAGGGFTRTGICTLVDMDSLEIEVDVSEQHIAQVAAGHPVTIVLDAYQDVRIPGHVIAIVPTADRAKSTVAVRISFDGRDDRILPNMAAKVYFAKN